MTQIPAVIQKDLSLPSYLTNLNEAQLKAVKTTEGPVLILAGAGTGKTRALTARVAHLIKENPSSQPIF